MIYYLAIPPQETDHEGSLKGQWNKLLDDADAKGIVVVVESGSMPLEFSVGIVIT